MHRRERSELGSACSGTCCFYRTPYLELPGMRINRDLFKRLHLPRSSPFLSYVASLYYAVASVPPLPRGRGGQGGICRACCGSRPSSPGRAGAVAGRGGSILCCVRAFYIFIIFTSHVGLSFFFFLLIFLIFAPRSSVLVFVFYLNEIWYFYFLLNVLGAEYLFFNGGDSFYMQYW